MEGIEVNLDIVAFTSSENELAIGEFAMRWTVRLAVVCVYARYLAQLHLTGLHLNELRLPTRIPTQFECWCWTTGFVFYVAHVCLAFQIVHDWSHAAAWQHTAEETARMTGISRGDGLWVNYLFTMLWFVDVVRLVRARRLLIPTSPIADRIIFGVFLFICLNATVVFGPTIYKPIAVIAFVFAWFVWVQRRKTPMI